MNGLTQLMTRLGATRLAAMVTVAVLILGFFAFLIFRVSAPQMAPIYTNLTYEDSAAIIEQLQSLNVPYEIRGEGEAILVPRDQIPQLRMTLAGDGLPTRGQVGYEIFDQQNTLGATSFVQNVNQVRALEGELARTISSLGRIKSARVHLVLPERELFRRERKDPTASIVLSVRGELSAGEIRAIQHLVASAIEGLSPNRVAIVDDQGQLLASGGQGDDASVLAGEIEEKTLGIETRMRERVEQLLANIVGAGRARVQVSAELDLNRLTRTSETYDPNGQVVRSTQTREVVNSASGPAQNGGVTVGNELPGGAATAGGGASSSEQGSTTEETANYEISRTTETEVVEAGRIKRLSVAVAVDGTYTQDQSGNATYTPRTEQEMAQITTLVRSAIGYDQGRGDQVEIVNLQFAERPDIAAIGTDAPGLFDFTRDDLFSAAEMLVTLVIALALLLFVLRPLLKKVLAPEEQPLSLSPADTFAGAIEQAPYPAQGDPGPDPNHPVWMDQAKSLGEAHVQTLKKVGTVVEENPKQAALVVRDWLSNQAA